DVVHSGRELQCHCPDPARIPALANILLRRLLPRVSVLHGRLPVHAASLADGGGAILLFGGSGAGKSALTAALTQAFGWNVLSDDLSILSSAKQPTVWSTARGVSLWPESRKELMLPDADCHPVHDYDGKIWYAPPPRSTMARQPLNAIVFLSRGSTDHR